MFVQKGVCSPGSPGKIDSCFHLKDEGPGEVSSHLTEDCEWINSLGPGVYLGR